MSTAYFEKAVLLILVLSGMSCNEKIIPAEQTGFSGITQVDVDGNIISVDPEDWVAIRVQGDSFKVAPVYPNPTHYIPIISNFSIPDFQKTSVEVFILNEDRDTVKVLVSKKEFNAGQYRLIWDLTNIDGLRVPPGIYRLVFKFDTSLTFGDMQIGNYTRISDSTYIDFAAANWEEDRYWQWLSEVTGISIDNKTELLFANHERASWGLPPVPSEFYYELIAKSNHYITGWKDESNGISQLRQRYLELWNLGHKD